MNKFEEKKAKKEKSKDKVPNRDNLRFISIAKYKAMKDGDIL